MFKSLFLLLTVALCADIRVGDSVFSNPDLEGKFIEFQVKEVSNLIDEIPTDVRYFMDQETGIPVVLMSMNAPITLDKIKQHPILAQGTIMGITQENNSVYVNLFFPKRYSAHPNTTLTLRLDLFEERTAVIYMQAIEGIEEEINALIREFSIS